jgi:hypothetical protein
MKPKPTIKTGFVIACFEGAQPKFMCKDSKRGHYVVTLNQNAAMVLDDETDAVKALAEFERSQGWLRAGSWRPYLMNSKTTFQEVTSATV